MGQAAYRKAVDPFYGRVPKAGRGLIISPPMEISGQGLYIKHSSLDPMELRFALLFWDRLVWPSSNTYYIASGPDGEYLEECGVLTRPNYTYNGDGAQGIARGYLQAFRDLELKEPGSWAMAQGPNSLILRDALTAAGRSLSVDLYRAIPVPADDVPLVEILEFKERRRGELVELRSVLDEFYSVVANAADTNHAYMVAAEKIDAACADVLKAGKEWKYKLVLSGISAKFELQPGSVVASALAGWVLGQPFELSLTAAAIGAGASMLKFSQDAGFKASIGSNAGNPYRYVYQFHKDLA